MSVLGTSTDPGGGMVNGSMTTNDNALQAALYGEHDVVRPGKIDAGDHCVHQCSCYFVHGQHAKRFCWCGSMVRIL